MDGRYRNLESAVVVRSIQVGLMRFFSSPKFTPSCPCGGKWDPVEACEGRCIGLVRINYAPQGRCEVGHCGHRQAVSSTDVRAVEACRAATRHPTRQRIDPASSPQHESRSRIISVWVEARFLHKMPIAPLITFKAGECQLDVSSPAAQRMLLLLTSRYSPSRRLARSLP